MLSPHTGDPRLGRAGQPEDEEYDGQKNGKAQQVIRKFLLSHKGIFSFFHISHAYLIVRAKKWNCKGRIQKWKIE